MNFFLLPKKESDIINTIINTINYKKPYGGVKQADWRHALMIDYVLKEMVKCHIVLNANMNFKIGAPFATIAENLLLISFPRKIKIPSRTAKKRI